MPGAYLYGWDSDNDEWVKLVCNAAGKLIIDPTEILEDTPTDGEVGKAPTSNWAYDWSHPSGSSFPSSPIDGQFWLHTPTGRVILYQYKGGTWYPVISHGAMTVYVDKTDGTDDVDHGTGVDSDAFKTVQYAIDTIPGNVGGNVLVYLNGETYDEAVVIRGKKPTGNYGIYIYGTLSEDSSGTSSANGTQGTGAVQGVVTDAGNMAGKAHLLIYLDADGDYRIIDSSDANDATICGTFTSQPLQDENYVIYDWGTQITSINVTDAQIGVLIYDIEITSAIYSQLKASVACYRCKAPYVVCSSTGAFVFYDSLVAGNSAGALFVNQIGGFVSFYRSKNYQQGAGFPFLTDSGAYTVVGFGSVIDGEDKGAAYGMLVRSNSTVSCYSTAANGYTRVVNCNVGLRAQTGGMIQSTANNQYNNNNTDESADAATFGYID